MATWPVQNAKANLSELIEQAQQAGPQIITRHGVQRAVVLSVAEYRRLTDSNPDTRNFIEFLLSAPQVGELDIERNPDPGRDIEL